MEMKPAIAVDLFAGCGGLSLGLIQGGLDVRVAVENDKGAAMTYWYNLCDNSSKWVGEKPIASKKNHPDLSQHNEHKFGTPVKALIFKPIQEVSGDFIKEVGEINKDVTLLAGGPPCQGFSTANTRRRCVEDPRSQLMWEFIRLTGEIKPRQFMIENVPGLLSFKNFLYLLMESLEQHDYKVRLNMLDAAGYGVPQRRGRIFIKGVRSDLDSLPTYPKPTHFDPKQLRSTRSGFSCATIAQFAFKETGFPKEDLKELWWNKKLSILMNKKTAGENVEDAYRAALLDGMMNQLKSNEAAEN